MASIYNIYGPLSKSTNNRYHKYICILKKRHLSLSRLIKLIGLLKPEVPIWKSIDQAVLYAVVGQMLSSSAASTILKRLIKRHGSPKEVIRWAVKTKNRPGGLCGLSQRKRRALAEWQKFKANNIYIWRKWFSQPVDKIRKDICSIWGFGNWSADMILIFYLGKMDVWPETDIGLKRACRTVFGIDNNNKIKSIVSGCETVAALYLWEFLDRKNLQILLRENQCG